MARQSIPARSRRELLTGVAGGVAAVVVGNLGRAQPAAASDDTGHVHLGTGNSTTTFTGISNTSTDGDALIGFAYGDGDGIHGISGTGRAVYGESGTGTGVVGSCPSGYGVRGESTSLAGVTGTSESGTGVRAVSGSGYGAYASSTSAAAVYASSGSNIGVYGTSASGYGVWGTSGSSYGVYGSSASATLPAVLGRSVGGNTGLQGYSGTNATPAGPARTGVFGSADGGSTAVGLRGASSTGRGAVLGGKLGQLKLKPSTTVSHPSSGQRGDFFVDKSGRLWFCKGGTSWKQLA
jgi:hypothetical protein